jgi:hypothetical protein
MFTPIGLVFALPIQVLGATQAANDARYAAA